MIRHAENFNKTDRANEPFKKVAQRLSLGGGSIKSNEDPPEARFSNASGGGRVGPSFSVQN